MIRVLIYDLKTQYAESGDLTLLPRVFTDEQLLMWLDLEAETIRDEQILLNQRLGLPIVAARAFQCLEGPVLEKRAGYVLMRFDELTGHSQDSPKTLPLGFFFTQRFLITRHNQPSPCIELLWQELLTSPGDAFQPALIAVRLAGIVSARYLSLLSSIEQHLDKLSESIHSAEELDQQRASLEQLHTVINEQTALFQDLDELGLELSDDMRERLTRLREHLQQAITIAERYIELKIA